MDCRQKWFSCEPLDLIHGLNGSHVRELITCEEESMLYGGLPKVSFQLFPLPLIMCEERVWLWSCLNLSPSSPSSPHFSLPHDHTHSHFLSLEFSVSLSKTLHGFTVSLSHSEPPPLLQWQLSHSTSAAQEHQPVHLLLSPLKLSHCRWRHRFQPPLSR